MTIYPVISIIVPVYGVEKYIAKCLISIQQQTFKDFECIVVDDDSPDNSINVAKQAIGNDKRFVFVAKPNGGLASARNFGLDHAKSEYIAFVDSDDWVEPTFLEEPLLRLEKSGADICFLDINYVDSKDNILLIEENNLKEFHQQEDFLISKNTITQFAWSKIYKRNVFDILRFDENIITYEDVYIMFRLLYGRKLTNISKPLYNYLQRGGTLSRDIKPTYLNDRVAIAKVQAEFTKQHGLEDKYKDYILYTYLKTFIGYCIVKYSLYSKEYKKDIAELKMHISPNSLSFKNISFMLKEEKRIGFSLLIFKLSPSLFRILIRKWYKEKIF